MRSSGTAAWFTTFFLIFLAGPLAAGDSPLSSHLHTHYRHAQDAGWEFPGVDGLESLLAHAGERKELRAISPVFPEIGRAVGVTIRFERSATGERAFRLAVSDAGFAKEIAARRVLLLRAGEPPEKALLRVRRTLQSLAAEVGARAGELAHQGRSVGSGWIRNVLSLFTLPTAHASRETITRALYDIASVACFVDLVCLGGFLFSSSKGKFLLPLGVASLVYIVTKLAAGALDASPDEDAIKVERAEFDAFLPPVDLKKANAPAGRERPANPS